MGSKVSLHESLADILKFSLPATSSSNELNQGEVQWFVPIAADDHIKVVRMSALRLCVTVSAELPFITCYVPHADFCSECTVF